MTTTDLSAPSHAHPHPDCPFCGAKWSDAMVAEFALFSSSGGCACCGDDPAAIVRAQAPSRDLCCASCGRAIYLKP